MLAKLGRTEEAVDEGLKYLTTPNEVQQVAQALRERGALPAALRIAEHGLVLPNPDQQYTTYGLNPEHDKAPLVAWTADLAAGMGEGQRALRAAEIAFRAAPRLSAFLKAVELASAPRRSRPIC